MPDKKMKLYIAGPVTGLPEAEYTKNFEHAAAILRTMGYDVEVPVGNEPHPQFLDNLWAAYMRSAIKQMMDCDGVVLLRGWHSSRGAKIERELALSIDMPVMEWQDLVDAHERGRTDG